MPETGWKVNVMRDVRRQVGDPALRAPDTMMDPTSMDMSSSARMSCGEEGVGAEGWEVESWC